MLSTSWEWRFALATIVSWVSLRSVLSILLPWFISMLLLAMTDMRVWLFLSQALTLLLRLVTLSSLLRQLVVTLFLPLRVRLCPSCAGLLLVLAALLVLIIVLALLIMVALLARRLATPGLSSPFGLGAVGGGSGSGPG